VFHRICGQSTSLAAVSCGRRLCSNDMAVTSCESSITTKYWKLSMQHNEDAVRYHGRKNQACHSASRAQPQIPSSAIIGAHTSTPPGTPGSPSATMRKPVNASVETLHNANVSVARDETEVRRAAVTYTRDYVRTYSKASCIPSIRAAPLHRETRGLAMPRLPQACLHGISWATASDK
jgi:hypothetical protein